MGQSTEELSRQIAGTRADLANDLDALGNRVSPQAIMDRRRTAARNSLHRARSRVMGSAEDLQQRMSDSTSSVASSAQDAMSTAEQRYEGSPLAAGLVAFGAGMVVSALFPASDAETRAARQVVDVAREQGQPVIDEVKGSAQEMAHNLKESAAEATQEVKETAAESAAHVKGEGTTAADEVRSEARQSSTGTTEGNDPFGR